MVDVEMSQKQKGSADAIETVDVTQQQLGSPTSSLPLETVNLFDVENQLGQADFDIAKERFTLARDILLCLFLLILFLSIIRMLPTNNDNKEVKEVFDTVFQSAVPIASLIIGYYFGSKDT